MSVESLLENLKLIEEGRGSEVVCPIIEAFNKIKEPNMEYRAAHIDIENLKSFAQKGWQLVQPITVVGDLIFMFKSKKELIG